MRFQTKVVLLALVALVKSDGISLGHDGGRTIYDEDTTANPNIWRQINNVTISADENEVIGGIFVTDLRQDKKGEAVIVDGGIGKQNVTIELKSPTALRGYEFHIQAFAVSSDSNYGQLSSTTAKNPLPSQDNSGLNKKTTLFDLEETETKGATGGPATKSTTEKAFAPSTPEYQSTTPKTSTLDAVTDKNKDGNPIIPSVLANAKMETQHSPKMSRSVKDDMVPATLGKDGNIEDKKLSEGDIKHDTTPINPKIGAIPVDKFIYNHHDIQTQATTVKTNENRDASTDVLFPMKPIAAMGLPTTRNNIKATTENVNQTTEKVKN